MTWWELGLAVFGWALLCFGLFHLGRLWERDHPKSEVWMPTMLRDSWEVEWDLPVRRGIYDQENEAPIFYGPHRRG